MSSALLVSRLLAKFHLLERNVAIKSGLTPQLAKALLFIDECKPCCVKKLTELMEIQSTSMSKILSRLSAMKMVTRSLDESDRRIERIELTNLGKNTAACYKEKLEQIAQSFSKADTSNGTKQQSYESNRLEDLVHIITHLQKTGDKQ